MPNLSSSLIAMYHGDIDTTELVYMTSDSGFMVRCLSGGTFALYELSDGDKNERYCGEYSNINEAIKQGLRWT